jgi:glutathione S-transferase
MSLTFFYAPESTASITTLVLEELGTPCEWVRVELGERGTKSADFLQRNPNGRVPTIVHDGVSIWESAAITIYLGETFGAAQKLWPTGALRGEAMKWVVWTNVSLGEAVYRFARNTAWAPEDQRNAKAGEAAAADARKLLAMLDGALAGGAYLAGEYSLADAHVCSFVDWVEHMKIDMKGLAHVAAWRDRCHARPAFARAEKRERG